jgi:hypothetical protein
MTKEMATILALLLGCPGGFGNDDPDAVVAEDPYFRPTDWAFETWGFYDGETLGEFRFYENSSGAVPAYTVIYLLGPGVMCRWIGITQIEGLAELDDDQWAGFAVSLTMTETDCTNLDPSVWGASNPNQVLDGLFLGIGWKDLTEDLDREIQEWVGREGWTYEKEYEDHAYTQMLGLYDVTTGAWTSHDVGPAFTYVTSEEGVLDLTIGELLKVERGDELLDGVLSGFSLEARPISEITPF